MTNSTWRNYSALALLSWVFSAAGAQDPPSVLILNQKEAVQTALNQNIDVQIATLNIAIQQQQRAISRSALLPKANLEASESIERFNLKATFGISLPDVPPTIGPFQAVHAGVSFVVPVFDLGLLKAYQASGHRLVASRDDAQAIREQIVLLTVSEYAAHLRADAAVAAARERVKLAARLLNQAQDLKADGVATKIDVSRADVRLGEENQRLIDAKAQGQTTEYALKRLLNLSDSTVLRFSDDKDFFTTPELVIDGSVGMALQNRSDLLSLAEAVKASEFDRKAALSRTLPTLTANGHWDQEGANLGRLVPGYKYELDFHLPLFTGGRLKAEREEAAIAVHKAELQMRDGRNRVVEQTRNAETELQAAAEQVKVAKRQVLLAADEVGLAEGRFTAGVTDNIEVVAGQDAVARANDAEATAFYRYAIARAQFARAVGATEQIYSKP